MADLKGKTFLQKKIKLVFCKLLMLAILMMSSISLSLASNGTNSMEMTSSVFTHNGKIPTQYTCEGKDLSPSLSWYNVPSNTKSLALIVDDPDAPDPAAPQMTWVHWVLYNLAPNSTGLDENIGSFGLPSGTKKGTNNWGKTSYGGPCPPIGEHRYFFKLYALDVVLPDLNNPPKAQLEKSMQGHIIEEVQMIGKYQKGE